MAKQQRSRLDAYPSILTTDIAASVSHEKAEYCVHAKAVDILTDNEDIDEEDSEDQGEPTVDFFSWSHPWLPCLMVVLMGLWASNVHQSCSVCSVITNANMSNTLVSGAKRMTSTLIETIH